MYHWIVHPVSVVTDVPAKDGQKKKKRNSGLQTHDMSMKTIQILLTMTAIVYQF